MTGSGINPYYSSGESVSGRRPSFAWKNERLLWGEVEKQDPAHVLC
jgi:hypothetical protein